MVGGGISTLIVGLPLVRAFVTPAMDTASKDDWIKVADDIALIDVDVPVRVTFVVTKQDAWIESRSLNSVWLYTTDGEHFKAFNSHCTHLGCGFVYQDDIKRFFCPCHRGQFDPKSGAVLDGPPPRGLDELKVQIRESAVYVQYKEFRLGIPERVEV